MAVDPHTDGRRVARIWSPPPGLCCDNTAGELDALPQQEVEGPGCSTRPFDGSRIAGDAMGSTGGSPVQCISDPAHGGARDVVTCNRTWGAKSNRIKRIALCLCPIRNMLRLVICSKGSMWRMTLQYGPHVQFISTGQ